MERLLPRVQPYAWGSHEALARLTGRPAPTAEPEAELWMGAHPAAPSEVVVDDVPRPLTEVIAADPRRTLGDAVAERFDGRLPFLLKVLAPVQALSIQVHPSAQEAAEAPEGTYADRWPKPEAFYALTEFHAFVGSRPFDEVVETARLLAVPGLTAQVEAVAADPDPANALLVRLLRLESGEQTRLADAVVTACAQHPETPLLAAVARVAESHPHDIGLVVLLTMVYRAYPPGDYAYLPAGVLHAYVHGVAVEIMASSDSVVRAGLTPKKIDVDELLRIVDLTQRVTAQTGEPDEGWTTFRAESPYFRLRTAALAAEAVPVPAHGQPRVLLVLDGTAQVATGDATLRLGPGESCFLSAADPEVTVRGDGTAFLASPGDLSRT